MFPSISLVAPFVLALSAFALPIPEGSDLNKRITHAGRGTWFDVGLGNCGQTSVASEPVVAIAKSLYDQNGGSNCGQWIHITNTATGATSYGQTLDSCQSCTNEDLDMSSSLFGSLAATGLGEGVLAIEWHFMGKDFSP